MKSTQSRRILAMAALMLLPLYSPGRAMADTSLIGTLDGGNVRPGPVDTQGTGQVQVLLSDYPDGTRMMVNLSYSGLAGTALSAGIYGRAWVNSTASLLFSLPPSGPLGTNGAFQGFFSFPPQYRADFQRGLFYVQLNSTAYPEGELRSQLPGISYSISPEVPPNTIATAEISSTGGSRKNWGYLDLNLAADGADILSTFRLTSADQGKTFIISQSVDEHFNSFVAALTDGQPSSISSGSRINGSEKTSTEFMFFHDLSSQNGVDLQGQKIDHIEIRFNRLTLSSPGSDPNHDGLWTDFSYGATVFVVAVPEPAPASLLIWGLAVLLFRKCRGRIESKHW